MGKRLYFERLYSSLIFLSVRVKTDFHCVQQISTISKKLKFAIYGQYFFNIPCYNITMDMQEIGSFLAELRKEKNLTQDELGEQIGVTNKTVSRWENGNYFPPVEILQMLSNFYEVSINELLSGERLNEAHYRKNAEEYIVVDLVKKRKEAKKRLTLSIIVACITIFAGLAIVLLSSLLAAPVWLRIACIVFSLLIIILGIGVCCVLTVDAGVYQCPNCGEKFVPSMKDFIFGAHTLSKRKLKCPKCGKKNFCKKKLS